MRSPRRLRIGLGLLLCAMALAGCQPRNKFVPPPPAKVTVAKPIERAIADSIEFTGNTKATESVEVRPRINGYLNAVSFEDGTNVEKGALLFEIEPAPFQVELDKANAELKRAEAALQLANADYTRAQELSQRNVIAQADFDTKEAQLATAKAGVESAQAAVKQAQLNLSYTKIRAPITGRIGRHLVDAGNLIYAEQTVLATIECIDPIHAYFNVSERDLLRLATLSANQAPNSPPPDLELALANESGFPHKGQLDYRELGVSPTTGTAVRRAIFPNPDLTLVPGLFVRVRVQTGDPAPRILLPDRAIATDQRGEYVLVVNEKNVVEERRVALGIAEKGMRVIAEGVSAGDKVVVNGLQRARPGTTVEPQLTELTMASGEADSAAPLVGSSQAGPSGSGTLPPQSDTTASKQAASNSSATKTD